MRRLLLFTALLAAPAPAQEDAAALRRENVRLRQRIEALEAEDARKTDLIATLRERLSERPIGETEARVLQNRIRNQILEIERLRREHDACETERRSIRREAEEAGREARSAEDALRRAERRLDAAERDRRRAESAARRYRSAARRCD